MDELPYQTCGSVTKICKRNKDNHQKESTYISREEWMNILSYVDLSKLYHVIQYFPGVNKSFRQKDITFPLSSSLGAIECRNKHLI